MGWPARVERTVIEASSSMRTRAGGRAGATAQGCNVAAGVGASRTGMTGARVDAGGGRWIWARGRRAGGRRAAGALPEHGVAGAVPWARHGAGHARLFDDQVAWLAVACSKGAVMGLMRIAWRTVGAIVTRVAEDAMAGVDRFAGLRRIG
jgi:transposase